MFDAVHPASSIPLPQSTAFARAVALLGTGVEELKLNGAGHALMQSRWLPVIGWVGLISRGPVWHDGPKAAVLADVLSDLKHPVLLNADTSFPSDLPANGFVQIMTPATVAQLDLTGSSEMRRAKMHQKWRNRLVRAEGSGLRIRREALEHDPTHWLLDAEAKQRKERWYRGLPPSLALAYAQANPAMAQVFTAQLKGEDVAAMLFLRHGPTATYFIGHSTQTGRDLNAHNLLLAQAADWLSEHGADLLELGQLDTENAPGLARFKLGIGAEAKELGGTWLYHRHLAKFAKWWE